MRKRFLCLSACLIALPLIFAPAWAQTVSSSDNSQDTLKIRTDLVVVDAQVTDKKTREIIRGLKVQDFELLEDGVKQEIEFFGQDKLPLSIVLLLDVSPSVRPVIEKVREGALQALQRLKPEDEVALMIFSGWTELIQDFTRDRQAILDKLGQALNKQGGGTVIHEAIAKAARQMRYATNPSSRRVILVVTDNQGSMLRQGEPMSEQEVKDIVADSGVTVCGLIVRSFLNVLGDVAYQTSAAQEFFKRTSVNPYAEMTGGEMTGAGKDEVNARLGEMIDRLRNRYVLGYQPLSQKFDGKFRRIKVSLTADARRRLKGDIAIHAKQGYYATDPETEDLLAEAAPETPAPKPPEIAPVAIPPENTAPAPSVTSPPVASPPVVKSEEPAPVNQPKPAWPDAQTVAAFKAMFKPPNPYAHLVMVDVQAVNKKTGAMVGNLSEEDFVLEDNGARRTIEHFSQGRLPLSVMLLIDVSGNTPVMLSSLRRGVAQWLRQLKPEDELALMAFGSNAEIIQDFTKDRKLIAVKFKNFLETARQKNIGGFSDRSKAVFLAADQMDKSANPAGRRVIITITDDSARSLSDVNAVATAQLLSQTDCVVYGIVTRGVGKPVKGKLMKQAAQAALFSFGNPVSFAIQMATQIATEKAMDAILKDRSFGQLVQKSGGAMVKSESEDAAEKLHLLLGSLRNRYVVGFAPSAPVNGEKFRPLKLTLTPESKKRAGDVSLLTAQGYFVRLTEPAADSVATKAEDKNNAQKQN